MARDVRQSPRVWLRERVWYPPKRKIAKLIFERGDYIDTHAIIETDELGVSGPGRFRYSESRWTMLPRVLRKRDVHPEDVFVDFGSGMGRVVCQAARYPFARVIGVELSDRLNEVARENIRRNRHRFGCCDVEVVTSDVLDFEIPDDLTYAYFFNPFGGDVFRTVINRIIESVDRNPRRLTLIYGYPYIMEDYLQSTGRFALIRRSKGIFRRKVLSNHIAVYECRPAGVAAPA